MDTLLHKQQDITPDPSVLAVHNDFLPKRTAQNGGGEETTEKPDRRYLSQVIKADTNCGKSHWFHGPLTWGDEMALRCCSLTPKARNSSLITKKKNFRQIPIEEHSAKYLTKNSLKLSKVMKTKESPRNYHRPEEPKKT